MKIGDGGEIIPIPVLAQNYNPIKSFLKGYDQNIRARIEIRARVLS